MQNEVRYSRGERFGLWTLAVFGLLGVNGAFIYGLLVQPDALRAAMTNPIAAAFMIEALVLVGVLAYLFTKWRVSALHWGWFVFLSFLGSLAFSIPVALLFRRGGRRAGESAIG